MCIRTKSRVARGLSWIGLVTVAISTTWSCGGPGPATQAAEARARLMVSEGGQRVLSATEAHGGLENWFAAPTSAYAWEYSNLGSNMRFESYLVADNRTRRVYHDLRTFGTPESVEPVDASFSWDGQEAWMSPADRREPNPRFWATTGYYFESIPFVMADPGVHFQVLPPDTLDGVLHDRVMAYYDAGIGDSPGDTYTMYLDQQTSRVGAVLYTVTYGEAYEPNPDGPGLPTRETLFYYLDYTTVDGLTVPTRFRGYTYRDGVQGDLRNEAWASEISFKEPFDEARLEMPEDARIEPYSVQ